ncbi:MAG: hypothetical protein Q8P63_01125 [Candidatus Nealsonbacteria bacterium]|nr:hypothetical protein [Candidatus Nealsonbacteria bacterium]
MLWLIVIIAAYFILAAVFLVDKYLLVSTIPNHKVYAFYVGILGISVLLLIPFIDFYVLKPSYLLLSFISGASFLLGLFWFFKGLKLFEPSRIVPAVGGILPISTFLLVYLFSGGKEVLGFWEISAFLLLILGSVLITYEKSKRISLKSLQISLLAAIFLAVSFVTAKYVYLEYPFLLGLIWTRLGGVLLAFIFLLSPQLRKELFRQKTVIQKNTVVIFLSSQAAGAGANVLQNWAIALAPLAYLAFINALQGVQYAFLLVLAVLISIKFPKILREEVSKEAVLQKLVAILFIGAGLAMLAF